jgi:signal transduction histidine kinase
MLRLENMRAAADRGEAGSPGVAASDVDRAVDEVNRLSSLVTSLLILERADEGSNETLEQIEMVDLIESRMHDWGALAEQRDVRVDLDLPDSALALARPLHVEQVLDNLVDNAISVSPLAAPIEVVLRVQAGRVVVHVIDRGPGMSEEQVLEAFNRFKTTRPSKGSAGGFGLGLPIVQRLVELDGGTVTLGRSPRGGVDARVSWAQAIRTESASAE